MKDSIYSQLLLKKRTRRKSFALLIDPDKVDGAKTTTLINLAVQARVHEGHVVALAVVVGVGLPVRLDRVHHPVAVLE